MPAKAGSFTGAFEVDLIRPERDAIGLKDAAERDH